MFCPSCGVENEDRRRVCGVCGALIPASPAASAVPPPSVVVELCGLAFASMFFGILAFLICFTGACFLPALGAVLFGHMSLVSIGDSPGGLSGRIFAIIGLVLGYGLLLILLTARVVFPS